MPNVLTLRRIYRYHIFYPVLGVVGGLNNVNDVIILLPVRHKS